MGVDDLICHGAVLTIVSTNHRRYVNPELAKAAKERGNEAFRAQEWGKAIKECVVASRAQESAHAITRMQSQQSRAPKHSSYRARLPRAQMPVSFAFASSSICRTAIALQMLSVCISTCNH